MELTILYNSSRPLQADLSMSHPVLKMILLSDDTIYEIETLYKFKDLPMYAINTAFGNFCGFFISVCIVGKALKPP